MRFPITLACASVGFLSSVSLSLADYCEIRFWDDAGSSGQSAAFYTSHPNMANLWYWPSTEYPAGRDPNDTFSSMEIVSGLWKICHNSLYRMCGNPRGPEVDVGNFDGYDRNEWQDAISSIELVKCDASVGAASGNAPDHNCAADGTTLLPDENNILQTIADSNCKVPKFE